MVNHIGEVIAGFENMIKYTEEFIAETTADRDAQKNILAQPFEKQNELEQKRARFNEVMELLAPKTEEQLGKTDDDTVQEQSRDYLEEGDDYATGEEEQGTAVGSEQKGDRSLESARKEIGDRRGISERVRENSTRFHRVEKSLGRQRGIVFSESDIITPAKESVE